MRKQYSKSDIKKFLEDYPEYSEIVTKKSNIVEEDEFISVDNETLFLKIDGKILPHLKLLLKDSSILPKVTVDMGAIKFVINGADIMRPGITEAEDFPKGSYVVIVDETHGKPLAVCRSDISSEELMAKEKGKVLKNLYYVGDERWNQ